MTTLKQIWMREVTRHVVLRLLSVDRGLCAHCLQSRKSAADIMEERRKLIIQPHPLSVKLTIRSSMYPARQGLGTDTLAGKLVLQVEFKYLSRLSIVTVFSSMENPITSGDILAHLFPGDAGIKSPNPTNLFQMDNLRSDG